jgi:hypothetical protein
MRERLERLDQVLTPAAAGGGIDPELAKYRDDPVAFGRDVLGVEAWLRQAEVLRAVAQHMRVAVRAGQKVGKSTTAAILALWFVCTRAGARVIFSSATGRQVRAINWREIERLHRHAHHPLGGRLFETPDRGLQFDDGREVVGFATDEPEKFSGYSGGEMLFILDEASGIAEPIFEAVRGNLVGGGRLVLFSNPTRTAGTFFDAFNRKSEHWRTLHISSLESPNVLEGKRIIPGLATKDAILELLAEWGESSPLYQVRVAGNFPSEAENAVIGLALVEAARARWHALADQVPNEPLEVGVDVARYGSDESVIFARRGAFAYEPYVYRQLDTIELAGRVLEVVQKLKRFDERPIVRVDVVGLGAGVADQLKRCEGIELVEVNVGESATIDTYARKRDEVVFALRDWLRAGGAIPPDPRLENELVAPTYAIDVRGKTKVSSKDELKAVLRRSPDRMDALALATYLGARGHVPYDEIDAASYGDRRFSDRESNPGDDWAGPEPQREYTGGRSWGD